MRTAGRNETTNQATGTDKTTNHTNDTNHTNIPTEIVYKDEAYAIVGACFEVYNEMGCGFVEPVYQECLKMEFMARSLPFHPQRELALKYKGRLLEQTYKPDFICFEKIVVEIKAVKELCDEHRAKSFV